MGEHLVQLRAIDSRGVCLNKVEASAPSLDRILQLVRIAAAQPRVVRLVVDIALPDQG